MVKSKQSKGGQARASALPAEARSEIAQQGAKARWAGKKSVKAIATGSLSFGDLVIECANLEDGRRVLSEKTVLQALGRGYSGYYSQRDKTGASATAVMPRYVAPAALRPFIDEALVETLSSPVLYKPLQGNIALGLDAGVLWKVCMVWMEARRAGALKGAAQLQTALRAETIMGGLGSVGIVALIDEATGYQKRRQKDELQEILKAYVAAELQPWARRFPDEFWKQMFRLKGWAYPLSDAAGPKGPRYAGKLVNEIVYDRLPLGVREELQKRNPVVTAAGRRRHRHHSFLTEEVGNDHLREHLIVVTAMMRGAVSWEAFHRSFNLAFPLREDTRGE